MLKPTHIRLDCSELGIPRPIPQPVGGAKDPQLGNTAAVVLDSPGFSSKIRSSSREVRKGSLFAVVYFGRGTLPKKQWQKGTT